MFGVWSAGYLRVRGVELSDHVREMSSNISVMELPDNAHGDAVAKVIKGLEIWQIMAVFLQDFAANKVDFVLSTLPQCGMSPVDIIIGGTGVPTTTSPWLRGNCILTDYRPLGGAHGSNLETMATFKVAGNLSYVTSLNDGGIRMRPVSHTTRSRPSESPFRVMPLIYNGRP